jgi:predicted ArsR family transcriptional regulator
MPSRSVDALVPLAEPVRRRVYEWVVDQPDWADRATAANALGIAKPLAAFHLDRLVRDGLLVADYRRRAGRAGPGAGRPAKVYRRAPDVEIEVSLPPRRYALSAEILAAGVGTSDRAADRAREEARRLGADLAREHAGIRTDAGLIEVLRAAGYEPVLDADQTIRLRNCPFDALVERHRPVICPINLALLESVLAGLGSSRRAISARGPGSCCVAIEKPRLTAA